jgi:hypothetical protein
MSMPPLEMYVNLFGGPFSAATQADRDRSERGLLKALLFLSDLDYDYLSDYQNCPSIFDAGVRYHHDDGVEKWYGIQESIARQYGDCKVFCAWLMACLHHLGVKALPHIKWRKTAEGGLMFHCLVAIPFDQLDTLSILINLIDTPKGPVVFQSEIPGDNSWIVDPSLALGMGWEEAFRTTNMRPATSEYAGQLAKILGQPSRTIAELSAMLQLAAAGIDPRVIAYARQQAERRAV